MSPSAASEGVSLKSSCPVVTSNKYAVLRECRTHDRDITANVNSEAKTSHRGGIGGSKRPQFLSGRDVEHIRLVGVEVVNNCGVAADSNPATEESIGGCVGRDQSVKFLARRDIE